MTNAAARSGDPAPMSIWRFPGMVPLAGYTVLAFAGFFVTLAALPAALAREGLAEGVAGSVTTVLLLTTVLCQLLVPRVVSRFGIARVLAISLLLLGLPSLLLLVADGLGSVIVTAVLRGAGFGGVTVLGSTLTARIVPVERRGEAIGAYGLAVAVPNLLAVPGGVALAGSGGMVPLAVLGAAPLVGLAVVRPLALAAATAPDHAPTGAEAPAHAVSRRHVVLAALPPAVSLTVVTLAGGAFITYLPIVRPDGLLATVTLAVWGITGAAARWRVGARADRFGLRRLLPGSLVVAITGVAIVVAGLAAPRGTAGSILIVLGGLVLGIGFGATQNLTLLAAFARAHHQQPAVVSSIWNAGFDTGTAAGAGLVGALLAVMPITGAIAVTGILIAACLPLAVHSGRPAE